MRYIFLTVLLIKNLEKNAWNKILGTKNIYWINEKIRAIPLIFAGVASEKKVYQNIIYDVLNVLKFAIVSILSINKPPYA